MLPEYRESLHVRYPPVCANCLPAVEEEMQDKEKMARTNALGSWLKETRGKERTRRVSGPTIVKEKPSAKLFLWRIRGCLWVSTFLLATGGYSLRMYRDYSTAFHSKSSGLLQYPSTPSLLSGSYALPILAFTSFLWAFWDPTYASVHRARKEGRDVRLRGKRQYIVCLLKLSHCQRLTSFRYYKWRRGCRAL